MRRQIAPSAGAPPSDITAAPRPATRCVVCERASARVVWREAGYEGRRCGCGTVYVHPEPPPGEIDPTRLLHPEAFYALPAAFKAEWVEAVTGPGRLLEIGCGEGHFLAAARARGYDVTGMEPQPARARRTAERLGIPVECARLEETRLPRGSFDVVYHCDLLSHFPDPVGALGIMRDLLGPRGRLCFEVGILGGISPAWFRILRHLGYPEHRWFYSESALYVLLRRAGLRVESVRSFGQAPRVLLGLVARALARIAGSSIVRIRGDRAGTATRPRSASSAPSVPRAVSRFDNFLRYRVGRFTPRIGPRSLFVVAVPREGP